VPILLDSFRGILKLEMFSMCLKLVVPHMQGGISTNEVWVTIHGQMDGQNIPKYILGFKVTLVQWGNACNKYHIVTWYVFRILNLLP